MPRFTNRDVVKSYEAKFTTEDVSKDDLILRVDLKWCGPDLDVCAFMLDEEGGLAKKVDAVYFKSNTYRWKTAASFDSQDFDPLDGEPSEWEKVKEEYGGRLKYWMSKTLPASPDFSVIGSWDDTGDDEGEEESGETIHVRIEEINTIKYKRIVFAAVVAADEIEDGKTFGDVSEAIVSIADVDTPEEPIVTYSLNEKFPQKDAVCFGQLIWNEEDKYWTFEGMEEGHKGGFLELANNVF